MCLVLDSSSSNSSVLSSGQQQQLLAGLLTIQVLVFLMYKNLVLWKMEVLVLMLVLLELVLTVSDHTVG